MEVSTSMTDSAVCATTLRFSPHRFTGKERDSESGNDYFEARYYSSVMGRFLSPDWSAKEEPVPYAKLDDPQSLNLYAYVRNNPLSRTDVAQQQNANSTQGQSTDYVSVSYWPKSAGGFGHIGVGVDTDDTQGYSTKDSHVPWYKRLFGAPAGNPEDDLQAHTSPSGEVAQHYYRHIPISADQAAAMKDAMSSRKDNPGHYNLIFNNCAQFVESVLHAGGVSGVPHAEVFGPAILAGVLWAEH